ncbi:MAG: enoyl-CoA hydratase-related protein [bacterium]|nr:enoyl-CoA hydratase-related protein [bacterium]
MTDETIRAIRRGSTLEVTLDRPKANAIDAATSRALGAVFSGFRDDPDLRVAIFTGAGERFFSAGWDLAAGAEGEDYEGDFGPGGFGGFAELPGLDKPVIAAVNGMAVGGGFELVMAADLVVAAEHATFFLPEASIGLIPDSGSVLLPRLLPAPLANEVLLAGRRLSAEELHRFGLVNEVVPGTDLMDTAHGLARRIAASAPLAVAAVLDIGRRTGSLPVAGALHTMRSGAVGAYRRMVESEDAQEGLRAFAEKRNPVWKGR